MRLASKTCPGCRSRFRPTGRNQKNCDGCRRKPQVNLADVVDVPTFAKLDSDGRENRDACEFALRLARKSSGQPGLGEYTRCLIAWAEDTSTGHIPPRDWQLRNLGHLISTRAAS